MALALSSQPLIALPALLPTLRLFLSPYFSHVLVSRGGLKLRRYIFNLGIRMHWLIGRAIEEVSS
jgi:hypothetical protein